MSNQVTAYQGKDKKIYATRREALEADLSQDMHKWFGHDARYYFPMVIDNVDELIVRLQQFKADINKL